MNRITKIWVGCLAVVFVMLLLGHAPNANACPSGMHAKDTATATQPRPKSNADASVKAPQIVHTSSQHNAHRHGDQFNRAPVSQVDSAGQPQRHHSGTHECMKLGGACCFGCVDVQTFVGVQVREHGAIPANTGSGTTVVAAIFATVDEDTRIVTRPDKFRSRLEPGSWRIVLLRASSRLRI